MCYCHGIVVLQDACGGCKDVDFTCFVYTMHAGIAQWSSNYCLVGKVIHGAIVAQLDWKCYQRKGASPESTAGKYSLTCLLCKY